MSKRPRGTSRKIPPLPEIRKRQGARALENAARWAARWHGKYVTVKNAPGIWQARAAVHELDTSPIPAESGKFLIPGRFQIIVILYSSDVSMPMKFYFRQHQDLKKIIEEVPTDRIVMKRLTGELKMLALEPPSGIYFQGNVPDIVPDKIRKALQKAVLFG